MPFVSNKSLRGDRIVHAAGRLFASQGYHGTSTRQIAHLAGISENTLFRHFEDKESLFWATLRAHFATFAFQRDLQEKIASRESLEVVLPKILDLLADTASYKSDLLRLILVAFIEMHPKGEAFIQEHFSPTLKALSQYLELNVKSGKMRDLDSTTAAAALTMTALTHSEISRLIDANKPLLSHQGKSRALARFWLDVLTPGEPIHVGLGGNKMKNHT